MQAAAILLLATTVGDTNDWPDYGYGGANVRSASERLIPVESMPPSRRTTRQAGFDGPAKTGTRVRNAQYNDGNWPNRTKTSQTEPATAPAPTTGYGGYTAPPPTPDRTASPQQRVTLPRDNSSYDYDTYRSADSSANDGGSPREQAPDHGVYRPEESPRSPSTGTYIPPAESTRPTNAPDTMELPPIGSPPARKMDGFLDPQKNGNPNANPNYGTAFRDPPIPTGTSNRPSAPANAQPGPRQSPTAATVPATPVRPVRQTTPINDDRLGNTHFLTLLALFGSIGLNLYLGWIAWDTYNRYQDLVSDMRYSGPRRDAEPAYEARMADAAY